MLRPSIYQVAPQDDFTVNVYFDDGRVKVFDAKPVIGKGGIFSCLGNKDFFKSRCVVLSHTLAWDVAGGYNAMECIDIFPDVIYENCPDY